MDRDLLPKDKQLTNLEILTFYLNMFKDRLIANVIDLKHYARVKETTPGYTKMLETGVKASVDDLILINKTNIIKAREDIEDIQAMIMLDAEGKLHEVWANEAIELIVSPLQVKDDKLSEGTNEPKH